MSEPEEIELWSPVFLNEDAGPFDYATCALNPYMWRRVTAENEGVPRIFAKVDYKARTVYVALGAPVQDSCPETDTPKLYLPAWLLDALHVTGAGDRAAVTWLSQEAFPAATRIVLRPHDSAFYHADAKEELERALTRLGVLRRGATIVVPIQSLDDYEIVFDVMVTEPADIVLAEGDEVVMEFEAALDTPWPPEPVERPGTPIPDDIPMIASFVDSIVQSEGIALGGGPTRRMPDGRAWNPYRDT